MNTFEAVLRQQLDECVESREIVAYHKWRSDPGIFLAGVVNRVSDEEAEFQMVDTEGRPDDLDTVQLSEILQLDRGTTYLENLAWLAAADEGIFVGALPKERSFWGRGQIREALEHASAQELPVRLYMRKQEELDGLVAEVGASHVKLRPVHDAVLLPGLHVVSLRTIRKVRTGGRRELADRYLLRLRSHG